MEQWFFIIYLISDTIFDGLSTIMMKLPRVIIRLEGKTLTLETKYSVHLEWQDELESDIYGFK